MVRIICTDCGRETDKLVDGRCPDCIASDNGPSADWLWLHRDEIAARREMEQDAQEAHNERVAGVR